MIFLSPFSDVTRMSMSTVSFLTRLDSWIPGTILESKGMHAIFEKKGKKGQKMLKTEKNAKYLKIWAKIYKNTKISHTINC